MFSTFCGQEKGKKSIKFWQQFGGRYFIAFNGRSRFLPITTKSAVSLRILHTGEKADVHAAEKRHLFSSQRREEKNAMFFSSFPSKQR